MKVIKTIMMKIKLRTVVTLFLAVVAGAGSFYVTRSLEADNVYSAQVSMRNWLAFTNEQDKAIRQSDPDFDTKAAELSMAFIAERQQLARLLDASGSTDEQITAQVEKVIKANHALIKRAVTYILATRKHLSPQQQQQFMQLCGNIIQGRAGKRCLLGGTNGGSGKQHFGQGKGNGRGPGQGRGMGQGRRRYRGGLSRNVEFTPEQLQVIQELDPEFDAKSTEFAQTASKEHEQLASLLNTPSASDEVIFQQLEKLLEARAQLERLNSQHVLLIRSHLSPEQQKNLVGLSANCGRRWNKERYNGLSGKSLSELSN
ncbi:MAG: periplasmic heavy metal sensor [Desulforhopalus sp.]|nr:periplasmic heavy metal sensor [Desulforhopalus sp.]